MKQTVTQRICDFNINEGPIGFVIDELRDLPASFPDCSNFRFKRQCDYETYGADYFTIEADRLETDAEYEARLRGEARKAAKKQRENKKLEEKERKEYIRLKKKFEK